MRLGFFMVSCTLFTILAFMYYLKLLLAPKNPFFIIINNIGGNYATTAIFRFFSWFIAPLYC